MEETDCRFGAPAARAGKKPDQENRAVMPPKRYIEPEGDKR